MEYKVDHIEFINKLNIDNISEQVFDIQDINVNYFSNDINNENKSIALYIAHLIKYVFIIPYFYNLIATKYSYIIMK